MITAEGQLRPHETCVALRMPSPHLVNLGQWGPHSSCRQPAPAAVFKQPPRRPLSPCAEHPAWGLLPLQRTSWRLVPAQLCPALSVSVAVGCAWLSWVAWAFRWCWTGGHTFGDVLVVCGWASLVGADGDKKGVRELRKSHAQSCSPFPSKGLSRLLLTAV